MGEGWPFLALIAALPGESICPAQRALQGRRTAFPRIAPRAPWVARATSGCVPNQFFFSSHMDVPCQRPDRRPAAGAVHIRHMHQNRTRKKEHRPRTRTKTTEHAISRCFLQPWTTARQLGKKAWQRGASSKLTAEHESGGKRSAEAGPHQSCRAINR